jgi:hypothetical protein
MMIPPEIRAATALMNKAWSRRAATLSLHQRLQFPSGCIAAADRSEKLVAAHRLRGLGSAYRSSRQRIRQM